MRIGFGLSANSSGPLFPRGFDPRSAVMVPSNWPAVSPPSRTAPSQGVRQAMTKTTEAGFEGIAVQPVATFAATVSGLEDASG